MHRLIQLMSPISFYNKLRQKLKVVLSFISACTSSVVSSAGSHGHISHSKHRTVPLRHTGIRGQLNWYLVVLLGCTWLHCCCLQERILQSHKLNKEAQDCAVSHRGPGWAAPRAARLAFGQSVRNQRALVFKYGTGKGDENVLQYLLKHPEDSQ